ncbi:MAG: hypothetical protein ABJN34_02825 [Litoreibacter sp.]|uniref:hypothetical protein n=1 Tax=Litoreibacter sp. TaxID=1969459 RepID=UPI003296D2AB
MTPNFALNLSEDGIVLLHRHPSGAGWVEIADAKLDSADLGADLVALRDKAEAIEGPDFTTKLILPPSQLLYATIETQGNVRADVEQALEERTPYTPAQLSYDISGDGPTVQVVAVARETLEEAEGFLGPYRFNPVGFTALPDSAHFDGSPNLGPLPSIGGHGVTDAGAFIVLSAEDVAKIEAPEPPQIEDPAPEEPSEPEEIITKFDDDEPVVAASDVDMENTVEDVVEEPDLPVTPPAAFSSRRKPSLGPATDPAGTKVSSRAPRIAIPTSEVKAPEPKTRRAEPRIKTEKAPPAIVPAPTAKPAEPSAPSGPSRLENGMATLRETARKAKERRASKKEEDALAAATLEADPIAELAARQAAGKPRFLGLILTGLLILALLLFAALSSYFLPEDSAFRFFGDETPETEVVEIAPTQETIPAEDDERLASLPEQSIEEQFTAPAIEETAEIEPPAQEITPLLPMTQTEAETAYATSGAWQLAPNLRATPLSQNLNDLYQSSLDPKITVEDAPALSSLDAAAQALEFTTPSAPPAASILRSLDSRGLVQPSVEGAENPDGVLVFSGRPPVAPVRRPEGLVPEADATLEEPEVDVDVAEEETVDAPVADQRLAGFKPTVRPSDLQEQFERVNQAGRSTAELARIRPQLRPESAQAKAREDAIARALAEAEADAAEELAEEARAAAEAAAQAEIDKPTAQAVARSVRPGGRPRNFERVVARARRAEPAERNQAAAASTAAVGRATGPAVARASRAAPTGAVSATVARAATDNNAIALGKVALVGVVGTSSNRSALVRMPNGRIKKVGVGDRVDGGNIAAIGESQLKYTKGGRTLTLQMPQG